MPLALDPEHRAKLVSALAEKLRDVRVKNGVFLDIESTDRIEECDRILRKSAEELAEYIGDKPFWTFVYDSLARELYAHAEHDESVGVKSLPEVGLFPNLSDVASLIVEDFVQLPFQYVISYELNNSLSKDIRRSLKPSHKQTSVRLVCPDHRYMTCMPLQSRLRWRNKMLFDGFGLLLTDGEHARTWSTSSAYIQFEVPGFIGTYAKTRPLTRTLSCLKAAFGLLLATGCAMIRAQGFGPSLGWSTPRKYLIVHRKREAEYDVLATHEIDAGLEHVLAHLEFAPTAPQPVAMLTALLNWLSGPPDERMRRLILASEWIFDSYRHDGELLSFVKNIVAMEVLLGDRKESRDVGVGALLGNRFAYLVGENSEEREDLIKFFSTAYALRSKILHRGSNELARSENDVAHRLKDLCARVISKEVSMLLNSKKRSSG